MLIKMAEALQRRQKAARIAEWLVWTRGAHGFAMARHAAMNHHQSDEQRQHWQLVERIAKRRLAQVDDLDTATRYEVGNRWAQRTGSLIR